MIAGPGILYLLTRLSQELSLFQVAISYGPHVGHPEPRSLGGHPDHDDSDRQVDQQTNEECWH